MTQTSLGWALILDESRPYEKGDQGTDMRRGMECADQGEGQGEGPERPALEDFWAQPVRADVCCLSPWTGCCYLVLTDSGTEAG